MNKRKKSRFGQFVILCIFLYCVYIIVDQQKVMNVKGTEIQGIQAKINEETRINTDLKKQKEMINSDEYTEKVAREKLGMVKHGEKIFMDVEK